MQGFEQMVTLNRISGVFILFGKVTSGGRNHSLFQKGYIILCNVGSRFELTLLLRFTIFTKHNGFEKFKIVIGST